jgi:hypothetical protein
VKGSELNARLFSFVANLCELITLGKQITYIVAIYSWLYTYNKSNAGDILSGGKNHRQKVLDR